MKPNTLKRSVLLVAFTLLLCGGSGRTKAAISDAVLELPPEPYTITFNVDRLSSQGAPAMSDVVESLEYIKLEFNPKYPIGIILGRPYIDDDYIIFAASHGTGLLQYTRQGKFVRRIGSIGRGPGEYLQLRGYWVDSNGGIIYTMPNWERAVDRYDLATGRYLGKTQIAEADGSNMYVDDHHNLFPLSGTTMVFSSIGTISNNVLPPHYVFSAIDLVSAQIVHREISKMYPTSGHSNIGSTSVWYDDRGRMNIIEEVNNTAYIINPDCSMSPKATFDLGRAMVNANNFQTIRSAEDVRSKLFFNPFLETHRYLCMQLSYDDNRYVVAFDKSSGKSTLLGRMSRAEYTARRQFLGFRNDIDGGFALQAANIYSSYDENTSFASYDAYKMIELLTPEHFAKVRSTVKDPAALARLRNFVASLKEEDNPVIVIAHLK